MNEINSYSMELKNVSLSGFTKEVYAYSRNSFPG